MNRNLAALVVLLSALMFASVAEAGPIIYFDTYRSLETNGTLQSTTANGAWFARDTTTTINRSQSSFIPEFLIDGAGHPFERIRAHGTLHSIREGAANHSTDLFTRFILDAPYSADLDVGLTAENDASAQGYLFDENTQTMLAQVMLESGRSRLLFEGVLEPGVYSYYLQAGISTLGGVGFDQHSAQFGGEFALRPFSPVPEPATMTLFGVGLAAVWRRRKASSAPR